MSSIESNNSTRYERSIRDRLTAIQGLISVPGIVAGLCSEGVRVSTAVGLADAARGIPLQKSSRFGLACLGKLLTAIVTHKWVDAGKLSLDMPVASVIPELNNAGFYQGVLVSHLLSHTGGYQGPLIYGGRHKNFDQADLWKQVRHFKQIFTPGTVFNYESIGHVFIGILLERISGKKLAELFDDTIFRPLRIAPATATKCFSDRAQYVASHQIVEGGARALAPGMFGDFWRGSLSDLTLTVDDLLNIGEALVGVRHCESFEGVRKQLGTVLTRLPPCASGLRREHSPTEFGLVCGRYRDGWMGYAGSALGQTCALRFNPETGSVCVVAMNAWLPIARDALVDELCRTTTHPEAGRATGNPGFIVDDLCGHYSGGGNLFRSVTVERSGERSLTVVFGDDGLSLPSQSIRLDDSSRLVIDSNLLSPAIGFFAEPSSGAPCIMIGSAALRKC